MQRKFLKDLGIDDDVINTILDENMKDIGAEKAKTSAADTAKATAETTIVELNGKITELSGKIATLETATQGTEALQAQIATLTAEKADFDNKLKEANMTAAIKLALVGQVHDVDLASKLIALDKIEMDDNGNVVKGLDEQIVDMKANKAFMFVNPKQEAPKPTGWKPAEPNSASQSGTGGINPWKKDTYNLEEQGRIYKEDRDRAIQMAKDAGASTMGL